MVVIDEVIVLVGVDDVVVVMVVVVVVVGVELVVVLVVVLLLLGSYVSVSSPELAASLAASCVAADDVAAVPSRGVGPVLPIAVSATSVCIYGSAIVASPGASTGGSSSSRAAAPWLPVSVPSFSVYGCVSSPGSGASPPSFTDPRGGCI